MPFASVEGLEEGDLTAACAPPPPPHLCTHALPLALPLPHTPSTAATQTPSLTPCRTPRSNSLTRLLRRAARLGHEDNAMQGERLRALTSDSLTPMYSIGRNKTLRKHRISQETRDAALASAVAELSAMEDVAASSRTPTSRRADSTDALPQATDAPVSKLSPARLACGRASVLRRSTGS